METREYIESGVLDLYAAGLLSIEEMRDVESMACQHPEIKTELQTIQSSLESYAMKHAMEVPAGVKERIMKSIEGSVDEPRGVSGKVVSIQSPGRTMNWVAAASIALLIVAGVMAIRYSSQVNQYKQQVAVMETQQSLMKNEMEAMKQSMSENDAMLALMSDTNTVHIAMKGTQASPSSLAMIYWNKQSQVVYLDVKNLPEAPADKQYQLWFIDPVKGPVDAGVFDVSPGIHQMKNAPAAAAFAVTLEPKGGSPAPHLDQMYVIGMVKG